MRFQEKITVILWFKSALEYIPEERKEEESNILEKEPEIEPEVDPEIEPEVVPEGSECLILRYNRWIKRRNFSTYCR